MDICLNITKEPFESFVNSEEHQTMVHNINCITTFESFVNSEEYQTIRKVLVCALKFESFVNSEEYQTKVSIENESL